MNKKEIMERISELKKQIVELEEAAQKQDEPKAWRPKKNEEYWYVDITGDSKNYEFLEDEYDKVLFDIGNGFPTKEHAERVAKEFKMLLKLWQYHDMFCPDYVPDWEDNQRKYCVFFNTHDHRWDYNCVILARNAVQVYFDSKETAQKVCDLLNGEEEEKNES